MPEIDWVALGLLMGTVLLASLYGLAASGHFPAEFRPAKLQRGWGALVLWGTMVATDLACAMALVSGLACPALVRDRDRRRRRAAVRAPAAAAAARHLRQRPPRPAGLLRRCRAPCRIDVGAGLTNWVAERGRCLVEAARSALDLLQALEMRLFRSVEIDPSCKFSCSRCYCAIRYMTFAIAETHSRILHDCVRIMAVSTYRRLFRLSVGVGVGRCGVRCGMTCARCFGSRP